MAHSCLKCLKYTMCVANLLCFICGVAVLAFGIFMMASSNYAALTPSLASFNIANILLITGIIITCVSFLGFLGALKENRCLLLSFFLMLFLMMLLELTAACLLLVYEGEITERVKDDLTKGLNDAKGNSTHSKQSDWDNIQKNLDCCGINNVTDWGNNVPESCCIPEDPSCKSHKYRQTGCLSKVTSFFEKNFLTIGVSVIVLCMIEVLGMCFAMTLFCHISRSGLGYKF
ncbi:leukocyte surface antigen CD53 [Pundamilia nyererei]|uniref:Tetraspanin n=1 Tax=Pundamilia nyererei TaxID=303518 RepID=A0A3B4GSD6_9CICH|nr:PREDICTED: leukocyte surface antigen CD53-like [Pundamilia nyererei]